MLILEGKQRVSLKLRCSINHFQLVEKIAFKVLIVIISCLIVLLLCQFDISTVRPKWRLDGPSVSGHPLYSLVNDAYANRYHHHLVSNIIIEHKHV